MPGLVFQLNSEVSDNSLPKLYPDALMSSGSLLLIDVRELGTEVVPLNNSKINNIAKSTAMEIMATTEVNVQADFVNLLPAAAGFIERTGKKGLHVAMSKTADLANNYSAILAPNALRGYIRANPNHDFYVSIWSELTRIADTTTIAQSFFMENTSNSYYLIEGSANTPSPSTPARSTGSTRNPPNNFTSSTGKRFSALSFKGVTGAPIAANERFPLFVGGNTSPYSGFTLNKNWSQIFYRVYVENLTLSGRTYADVLAKDQAMWNAANAVGGRFNADTFTAPSTLA